MRVKGGVVKDAAHHPDMMKAGSSNRGLPGAVLEGVCSLDSGTPQHMIPYAPSVVQKPIHDGGGANSAPAAYLSLMLRWRHFLP